MDFDIIGEITDIETIAAGKAIRERKSNGSATWTKA